MKLSMFASLKLLIKKEKGWNAKKINVFESLLY